MSSSDQSSDASLPLYGDEGQEEEEEITFRDCWLLFGNVDDYGWTHTHNIARKDINLYLREKYPFAKFESLATPNTFFMSTEERHSLIQLYIEKEHCDFIFASSKEILNDRDIEYAEAYPNVSFGRMLVPPQLTNKPPNLVDYWTDWFPSSFVAGAVAAVTTMHTGKSSSSNQCAGFINAFETAGDAWGHATGFAMGYRWMNPNATVHVVTMNSYYDPNAEVLAAKELVEKKGCDVIGKHTDPNDVDRYIYSLRNNAEGRKIISVSRYIDMSLFVGDTVITSQVTDFFHEIMPSVESSFLSKLANRSKNSTSKSSSEDNVNYAGAMYKYNETTGELDTNTTITAQYYEMKLSPFTNFVNEKQAKEVVTKAQDYLENSNPLCGKSWRINGMDLSNGNRLVCSNSKSTHLTPDPIESYLDLGSNVIYYDTPFEDGGSICGAGTYYEYDSDLKLKCQPCPINTYHNIGETNSRTESTCSPCGNGRVAPESGSTSCIPYVEEDLNQLDGIAYFGFVLAASIAILSIGFAIFVRLYKNHRVVKASQPIFLYLLLFGTFLMGLAIVPLAIDDSITNPQGCDIACVAFPWLLVLGFSSSFAALFSKVWRINKIFKASLSMKRIKVKTSDVMIPFIILITLNVVLLLSWTIIDPPKYVRIYKSESESFGTCWSNWSTASITIVILLVLLNSSAVIFANVQAYRARFISDEFSESKYIGSIMASFLQILLVALPLIFLVYENPRAFFFVVSSIVMITSTSLLLLMFVPKLIYVWNKSDPSYKTNGFDQSLRRASRGRYGSRSSILSTEGNSGLRFTNEAEIVPSLKKELEDCKNLLKKANALLHEKRFDLNYKIPEIDDGASEKDVVFEEVNPSSLEAARGSCLGQFPSTDSCKSVQTISNSSGNTVNPSSNIISEGCLERTESSASCKSMQSLSRVTDAAGTLPRADTGLDRNLKAVSHKGTHLQSISSGDISSGDSVKMLCRSVIDGWSDDQSRRSASHENMHLQSISRAIEVLDDAKE